MYEYLDTAFKVIVGVITNERLAIAAVIALCIMLIWVIFSLVFSFQLKFAHGARKINDYISQKGMNLASKPGLDELSSKMSSEFARGYKNYWENPDTLPSEHIKRFQSLDVELSGGVFNQNKSILKTYTNFVFVMLLVLSVAILSTEEALTGVVLAEAAVVPLMFLFFAKVIYYVYTAIRQHQYHIAVDEFNDMLDNMDAAVRQDRAQAAKNAGVKTETTAAQIDTAVLGQTIKAYLDDYFKDNKVNVVETADVELAKQLKAQLQAAKSAKVKVAAQNAYADDAVSEGAQIAEDAKQDALLEEYSLTVEPEYDTIEKEVKDLSQKPEKTKKVKEEKPEKVDFTTLLEDEAPAEPVKRGRGRPKKEVNQPGGFVINNDKDFEEALVRAEKLMRKNEEPLSSSQTKRIEKQIKELVDAMTKYKEGK